MALYLLHHMPSPEIGSVLITLSVILMVLHWYHVNCPVSKENGTLLVPSWLFAILREWYLIDAFSAIYHFEIMVVYWCLFSCLSSCENQWYCTWDFSIICNLEGMVLYKYLFHHLESQHVTVLIGSKLSAILRERYFTGAFSVIWHLR